MVHLNFREADPNPGPVGLTTPKRVFDFKIEKK
jgi:hypothetical protein